MTSFNSGRGFRHQQVLVKWQDPPNHALDIFLFRFQSGAAQQALIQFFVNPALASRLPSFFITMMLCGRWDGNNDVFLGSSPGMNGIIIRLNNGRAVEFATDDRNGRQRRGAEWFFSTAVVPKL
jgi:hypothetical protein